MSTTEPAGLGLSLDDLIKKNAVSRGRGGNSNRGGGRGGSLGAQGGVNKVRSPQTKQAWQQNGRGGGSGGRGGGYGGGRGQGRGGGRQGWVDRQQGGQHGGRGAHGGQPPRQYQQQHQQQGRGGGYGYQGGRGHQGPRGGRHAAQGRGPYSYAQPRARPPTFPLSAPQDEDVDMEAEDSGVEVWVDDATANVVATLKDTNIVTVGPDGTILLDTGGWVTLTTLTAMNEVLSYLQMKIMVSNEDIHSIHSWSVHDGMSIKKFTAPSLVLPPKGYMAERRGELLYYAYHDPDQYTILAASVFAAPAATTAGQAPKQLRAAGSLGGGASMMRTAPAGGGAMGTGMGSATAAGGFGAQPLSTFTFGTQMPSITMPAAGGVAAGNTWTAANQGSMAPAAAAAGGMGSQAFGATGMGRTSSAAAVVNPAAATQQRGGSSMAAGMAGVTEADYMRRLKAQGRMGF